MKDITRIHVAKVPYEIELTAKKELEKYISALEAYTSDAELLNDIEIRMTELLLERAVKQDDVISSADVAAIREQLGEPKDFMTDESTLDIEKEVLLAEGGRKLYRNVDGALLGGVLGGIARYFKINALWVRLAFIILLLASFGTFALIYLVLWLIVPPARTAAEKLQLAGRSVTLASIRELNESGVGIDNQRRLKIQKRVATIFLGILALFSATLTATGLVVSLGINPLSTTMTRPSIADMYQIPLLLASIAGGLLVVFFLLAAIAAFSQKFNKRIWISGIIIIVLGLGSFGSAMVSGFYQQRTLNEQIQRDTVVTSLSIPDGYKAITSLSVDLPDTANVIYVADDNATSIKQRSLKTAPKVSVEVSGSVLKITLKTSDQLSRIADNTVTIYGPRLSSLLVTNGYVSYNGASQSDVKAEVYNSGSLRVVGSRIDSLSIKTDGKAQFSSEAAAVSVVKASIYGQSSVGLGNIKSLDVSNPDVCASHQTANLSVQNILGATYLHNGIESPVRSTSSPCLNIAFSSDMAYSTGYRD